mgnify:CR=1 FL=1
MFTGSEFSTEILSEAVFQIGRPTARDKFSKSRDPGMIFLGEFFQNLMGFFSNRFFFKGIFFKGIFFKVISKFEIQRIFLK